MIMETTKKTKVPKMERDIESDLSNDSGGATNDVQLFTRSDRIYLLSLFPEEVWELILNQVLDPCDLLSVSNSSPFLRQVLKPRRTTFLFPSVWRILAGKFEKYHQTDAAYNAMMTNDTAVAEMEAILCEQCERQRSTRWYSGILICRLVSHTWCEAVDTYFEEHHNKCQVDDTYPRDITCRNVPGWWETNLDHDVNYLQCFQRHFDISHPAAVMGGRKPFLGRQVTLGYIATGNPPQIQQRHRELVHCLSKYGTHILECRMHSQVGEFYSQVGELLALMPNLTGLEFWGTRYAGRRYNTQPVNELARAVLIFGMRAGPLPTFPHLQLLKIGWMPAPIFNEIIQRNHHVSMLHIDNSPYVEEGDSPCAGGNIFTTPFPNLKQIAVKIYRCGDFTCLENARVRWPTVTKLCLYFDRRVDIEWARIFNLLRDKWDGTLFDLVLDLPEVATCNHPAFRMGRLTHLKIGLWNYSSLDFLLPLQNTLEHLQLVVRCDLTDTEKLKSIVDAEAESTVMFFKCFGNLYQSNIWILFPKLKSISLKEHMSLHFKWDRYTATRKQYQEHQLKI